MASTRKPKAALFKQHEGGETVSKPQSAVAKREQFMESEERRNQHQPVISNAQKIKLESLHTFDPLTDNQKAFFDAYNRGDYFMGLFGSPGTGKTFCAMYKALGEVLDKSNPFKKLVVVRSCVQTRDVGFLPGNIEEKAEIYEMPYKEICTTLFDNPLAWDRLKEQHLARFITTTAIRGISLDESVILVDESQSMTWHELSTILTRVGYRSKIIFSGDWKQNDLIKSRNDVSGLQEFLKVARSMNEFTEFQFTTDDIVRSSLVKSFIIACEQHGY